MNKIFVILLTLPLLLASCDNDTDIMSLGIIPSHQEQSRGMKVTKTVFSNDSSKISIYLDRTVEEGDYDYEDPKQVKIKVREYDSEMMNISLPAQPTLESFTNIGAKELKRSGLVVNVLIDLTQPVSVLNQQRDYVYKMSKDLCKDNLYLTFMYAFGRRSPSMLATPYVIENYISRGQLLFDESDSIGLPYIYRTVTNVINEMQHSSMEPWVNAKHKALIIFSDGVVYDGDRNVPLDPEHFQMQLRLVNQARHIPTDMTVSYINLNPTNIDPAVVDVNMMKMLCNKAQGQFYDSFSWEAIKTDIESTFNIRYSDYLVTIKNPNEKIYFGNKHYVEISFRTPKDSILSQAVTTYSMGSVYHPVCIGEYTKKLLLIKGLVFGGLLLFLVYFIAQVIVPYILYRMFRKKYVARYEGQNMVLNSIKVPTTCYYCKAPFRMGDSIVAKCEHVMHEQCWNENDYHCPEHGVHCPDGSHYYNHHNLFDTKNASFYMKWALVATIAAMLAWTVFMITDHHIIYHTMEDVICSIFNISNPNEGKADISNLSIMTAKMYQLPGFGIYLSFILTLFLSILTTHHNVWYRRTRDILLRAILAGIAAFACFAFENFVIVLGHLYDYSSFLDWIPWAMSAFVITFLCTYRTRVRPNHKYMLIAAAGGFVSTLFWEIFGIIDTVDEVLMLILCNVIFAVAVAMSIAKDMPRKEHYFLHVIGEIKEMDIALYKWLRQSPESIAYIGRSVDCHLQITWDVLSDIAPVHAAVVNEHGVPQLRTIDGDVYLNGKLVKEDKSYTLYHGDAINIGTTTFKFIEM